MAQLGLEESSEVEGFRIPNTLTLKLNSGFDIWASCTYGFPAESVGITSFN